MKLGQPIRTADEVNEPAELHDGKAGTPTMGGVIIVSSVMISVLLFTRWSNPFVISVIFVFLGLAAVGFLDDYQKVKKNNSKGISAKTKLLLQVLVALIAGLYLFLNEETSEFITRLYVPFNKNPIIEDMGFMCVPFFILIIVGCSNAVNLTDGLDGLAIGCSILLLAYAALCYLVGNQQLGENYLLIPHSRFAGELTIVCLALVGSGLGFLWFNCLARVFMGDTGSLALGGAFASSYMFFKHEILLIVVGGVFVMEATSVILQVLSYKIRGKRLFRMSPIHHHFELKGWHESQVITRFWILSLLCALIGLATLKLR